MTRVLAAGAFVLLLLLLLLPPARAGGPADLCALGETLAAEGIALHVRGQHLLAATRLGVPLALGAACADRPFARRSRLFYGLALQALGETGEATRALAPEPGWTPAEARPFRLATALLLLEDGAGLPDAQDRARVALWQGRLGAAPPDPALGPEVARALADIRAVRPRSPALAGTLSAILPGAGQAYNGAWQSAALALALNAALAAATLQLASRDLAGPAIAAGLAFSITYGGNIYSAIDGAHSVNRAARREAERELRRRLFPELEGN